MFGFRARCQDKLALPAGPNHCLLSAWLACLLQSGAWPPPRPALPCPPSGVGTEGPQLLLLGRGPCGQWMSCHRACHWDACLPTSRLRVWPRWELRYQIPAANEGGGDMHYGGGVSTWSCLHRPQLFQMCRGSRCGDDSAWNGEGGRSRSMVGIVSSGK